MNCTNNDAESNAMNYLEQCVTKKVVKSKSAMRGNSEINVEVRLKDDNTDFIGKLSEMPGVNSAVIVSYNGDYMG